MIYCHLVCTFAKFDFFRFFFNVNNILKYKNCTNARIKNDLSEFWNRVLLNGTMWLHNLTLWFYSLVRSKKILHNHKNSFSLLDFVTPILCYLNFIPNRILLWINQFYDSECATVLCYYWSLYKVKILFIESSRVRYRSWFLFWSSEKSSVVNTHIELLIIKLSIFDGVLSKWLFFDRYLCELFTTILNWPMSTSFIIWFILFRVLLRLSCIYYHLQITIIPWHAMYYMIVLIINAYSSIILI